MSKNKLENYLKKISKKLNLIGGKRIPDEEIESFVDKVAWDKPENYVVTDKEGRKIPVVPTIMVNTDGEVYGLVYSSRESLILALKKQRAIMYSRNRKEIWVKSPLELDKPTLLSVTMDCDSDALIFKTLRHGNFCHLGKPSCFQDRPTISVEEDPIVICVPSTEYKEASYKFLDSAGIHIYPNFNKRTDDMIIKTTLYPNLKVIPQRPKLMMEMFRLKMVNVVLCFDDNMETYKGQIETEPMKKNIIKIKSNLNKIKICAAKKKGKPIPRIPRVVSEYNKEITEKWLKETKVIDESVKQQVLDNMKYLAHTEGFIDEFFDISLLIVSTGVSLAANNLEEIEDVWNLSLCMYIDKTTYEKNPRFFRYMRNALTPNELHFYSVDDADVGFMSNFYPAEFTDDKGVVWKTSEHYYQAYKFEPGSEPFERIRHTKTARECYNVAWEYKDLFTDKFSSNPKEPSAEWAAKKDKVMREALLFKFNQNPALKEKLLNTGDKILIEHAMKDGWYGTGQYEGEHFSGKNMLGKMLMELRNKYNSEK